MPRSYSLILMEQDRETLTRIDDLFGCEDILREAGSIHPEEKKIFKQEYQRLRDKLNFTFSIEEADEAMLKRTKQGKYYLI